MAHLTQAMLCPVRSWGEAWHDALYGPSGFFLHEVPGDHFRTNVAVPLFAIAVRRLAGLVDTALGCPDPFDVVDVGAGRGELLAALPDVPARWRLTGVEVGSADVPFRWSSSVPSTTGLLIANEWLDNVPLDIVENGRRVLVSSSGEETLGEPLSSEWAQAWWPPGAGPRSRSDDQDVGPRVEIGETRDVAWARAVAKVHRGLAVAIDYGHLISTRRPTLTGYRGGRQMKPVPDGSCDLTAHVALDSVAAATGSVLVSQQEALAALGVSASLPTPADPSYAVALEQASQARELLDPDGLGGFGWLLRPVGIDLGWMSPWTR